jgi:CTP:molybdopterin cytidylyltransferase MocA
MSRTVAVVLAAGAGSRFAGPHHKLAGRIGGQTLLERSVTAALDAGIGPVLVVTGAHRGALPNGAIELHHPGWADGQATSLGVAIDRAAADGADAVVVGLADQPFVDAESWRRVAASTSPIAVATYDGVRGNPVRLAAEVWPLLPRSGDQGARQLMQVRPDLVDLVPCPGSGADIDTWEDLQPWLNDS